jgi:hypothetical protein
MSGGRGVEDDAWPQIFEEFKRRDATRLKELVAERISPAWTGWVMTSLEYTGDDREPFNALMDTAWCETGVSGEKALLLAVYLYVCAQQAWELSADHVPIRSTVVDALNGWRKLGSPDTPDALVVELMLRHAASLSDCMYGEDAMNCSSPIKLQENAKKVVRESCNLLDLSKTLPQRWDGFRQDFLDAALRLHRDNYAALAQVGHAVNAWIECGPAAGPQIAQAITFVREQELAVQGDVYESELRCHRQVLEAIANRIADPSIPTVQLDEASVTYCYPFALHVMSGDQAVRRAVDRLDAQTQELSDVWTWGGTKRSLYQSVTIPFPDLSVQVDGKDGENGENGKDGRELLTGHVVEIRLSRLGNHAVYIQRRFRPPVNLHEVHQAMRRVSMRMGPERITAVKPAKPAAAASSAPVGPWYHLPLFAEGLVNWVVEQLTAEKPGDSDIDQDDGIGHQDLRIAPDAHISGYPHVLLEVRKLSAIDHRGRVTPAGVPELLAAAGPLLLHPIRPNASGLEEWVRNPVGEPRNLAGDMGFTGDLVVRTSNTSILVMTATPNWVLINQVEIIDFAASLPTLLLLWREILDPDSRMKLPDPDTTSEIELAAHRNWLQERIRYVRRQLAILHSPNLMETVSHRAFLERLYDAAGLLLLEDQILEAIKQVEATYTVLSGLITAKEKSEQAEIQKREASYQRSVQLVLVVISFFSIADLLTFVNGLAPWIPHHRVALLIELVCAACLFVLTLMLVVREPMRDLAAWARRLFVRGGGPPAV